MKLEDAVFNTILAFQEKAQSEGWAAFENVTHTEEPPFPNITQQFRDDPDALNADMARKWAQFADTLDAKQRPLYDAYETVEQRLHDPATPQDDRELVREERDDKQSRLYHRLNADQRNAYNNLESIGNHISGLEEEERRPEYATPHLTEPQHRESHYLPLDAPPGASAAEMILLSEVIHQSLLKYYQRKSQAEVADVDENEHPEIALIKHSGRVIRMIICDYDEDNKQIMFAASDPNDVITGEFDGALLKQCIKNTLRDLRRGWKKTQATDPLTGETHILVKKPYDMGMGDLERTPINSADYYHELMAEVGHISNAMVISGAFKRTCDALQKQGALPPGAMVDDGPILNGTYFGLSSDERLRTPRYFAYLDKVEEMESTATPSQEGCMLMTADAAQKILGELLQMPEFMPSPPSPGYRA